MIEPRSATACSVFEGNIVVCGGRNNETINTVEAYDHIADSWSYMPRMIKGRYYHKSVAVKSKMYIIGGFDTTCEVFDSTCNIFSLLKAIPESFLYNLVRPAGVFSIGSKILILGNAGNIIFYDTINFGWSEKSFEYLKYIERYSCAKLPEF